MRRLSEIAAVILLCLPMAAAPADVLRIVNPTLAQFEDGPPLAASYEFLPGETLFLSFQVAGYKVTEDRIMLSVEVDSRDPEGIAVVEKSANKLDEAVSREDKDWLPKVRRSFEVPQRAPTGTYRILISIKDDLGGTQSQAEVPFHVRGHAVEPSRTLVVRNFRFLKSEDDREPMVTAVYKPGESLWVRFDITGYKLGDKNRLDVGYGVAVLGTDDKVLYSQAEAATEAEESFYPKRYVPGVFSLNLEQGVKAAQYTLLVTVHDKVGSQKYETKQKFTVQ